MLGHQLGGAVGQQLVLLDDDVALVPHRAEVAELDQGEVRLEDEDVVQLHVQVAEVLGVDPLERGADLAAHALGVGLAQAELGDVGGEVAQRRVLGGEHEVAVTLEHGVIHLRQRCQQNFAEIFSIVHKYFH